MIKIIHKIKHEKKSFRKSYKSKSYLIYKKWVRGATWKARHCHDVTIPRIFPHHHEAYGVTRHRVVSDPVAFS